MRLLRQTGFRRDKDFTYNGSNASLTFWNESEIYLKDLFQDPSDPEFDSLGSSEFTGAFIDEGAQITSKAKDMVLSRLRYRTQEYGILGKLFIASNPCKNFLYYDYYQMDRDKKLPKYRKYVAALPKDNPHLDPNYIKTLERLDQKTKERLLFGNWEYDDDPSKMINYDKILDLWTNKVEAGVQKYIIVDPARFGKDKATITYWEGLLIKNHMAYKKSSMKELRLKLEEWERQYQVPRSNILTDEDGVGGGLKDEMAGIKGFLNGSRPIAKKHKKLGFNAEKEIEEQTDANYVNLKTQCYYKLADYVNIGKIGIYEGFSGEEKQELIQELEQVKRDKIDSDGKLRILSKERVKELLGRSPDWSDNLMMRMYFELNPYVDAYMGRARVLG